MGASNMKEYILNLEKEFSLIENRFKEEEKRVLADYQSNDNAYTKNQHFQPLNLMYVKLECKVYFSLNICRRMKKFLYL